MHAAALPTTEPPLQEHGIARPPSSGTSAATRLRNGARGFLRGGAAFLGCFSIANVAGALARHGFDANIWWLDTSAITVHAEGPILAAIGLALLGWAIAPAMARARRAATIALVGFAFLCAVINTVGYYIVLANGSLADGRAFPFSLLVAALLAMVLLDLLRRGGGVPGGRRHGVAAWGLVWALLFPLMQMYCFGASDYRRNADAIVVLGAKAYADGTPSVPLADRVRTACELYHRKLAPVLIFSGGPSDGPVHETEAMRRMALRLGVPAAAIVLDTAGVNTRGTVRGTVAIFQRLGATSAMVVSNAYHLPRIKMAYQRAGWNVYTVPATESYTLGAIPYYVAREAAGIWAYYVSALWQ